jgi:hypothetical protein
MSSVIVKREVPRVTSSACCLADAVGVQTCIVHDGDLFSEVCC